MNGFIGDKTPGTLPPEIFLTPDGGYAIKMINSTGAPSIKGYICKASTTIDNGVQYTNNGNVSPIGIMYSDGVPNGEDVYIVISGKAYVYYGSAVVRSTFSRVQIAADIIPAGQAMNEALPVPPFATDKHFQEIGHPIESRGTPGLALTVLHFN